VVLLALDGQRSRLRFVVRAAAEADDKPRKTLRAVLRSLCAGGLIERVSRNRYRPTATAAHAERRRLVGETLWDPKGATARDLDVAVLLLASGTLSARARRLTRGMMVSLPGDAITPVITWLLRRYGVSTTTELADAILRETPEPAHIEEVAAETGGDAAAMFGPAPFREKPGQGDRTTDDLLDGLSFRDFIVLVTHATGGRPTSLRSLLRLRRSPFYVRRANRRLIDRGLLAHDDGDLRVTKDGARATRTGAALFALEEFQF
jgi:hypothetical protein